VKLAELTEGLEARRIGPEADVRGVEEDSRAVKAGDLFVALRGRTVDGGKFAPAAVAAGAVAVLCEEELGVAVPQVIVPPGRAAAALAVIAGRLAGRPAERMALVGITGTNGKTTSTFLVEAMLAAAGAKPGVIGTVNYRFADTVRPAPFTTPTPVLLHGVFAEMAAAGTTHVVMEVSSHALALDRLAGVTYRVAAFTNLTQDHLDLHGTMEEYEAAKRRLYAERLAPDGVAVAMVDGGPAGERMLAAAHGRRLACSISRPTDVSVTRVAYSIDGIDAAWRTPRGELSLKSRLLGEFNLSNLTLAVGIGEALDLPHEVVRRGLESVRGVHGRLDRVEHAGDYAVLVDYAHTPDALERAMAALRPLTRGRLIVVFGCGGDRDRTKRPIMGRAVARDADLGVVTSDNPRTEDPLSILDMIRAGVALEPVHEVAAGALGAEARGAFTVVPDRREAIRAAVKAARTGDVVLIAGKGHEDYQILGKTKIHFDDKEEAAAAIVATHPSSVGRPGTR
jgi:UDP-N-acetylmuramyl-tripeptide synthetase